MNVRGVAVCGLLVAAACAGQRRPAEEELSPDTLVLEVENHNWADVVIYVIHDGTRSRFMDLGAAKSAVEPIPARFVGSDGTVSLLVHRIGSADNSAITVRRYGTPDDYLTPTVSVRTGKTLSLTLESDLVHSTIGVW